MTYGLTTSGFEIKPFADIQTDLEAALRNAFGQSINLRAESVFGQLVGIMSDRHAELWEALEALHAARDPDRATGAALDAVCALTGTLRLAATQSTATLLAVGTAATLLPAGRVVSVSGTGARFATTADATLVVVASWAQNTAIAQGATRTNDGKVYVCTVAGTTAAAGTGPTATGSTPIVDGTVTWRHLGAGTAAVSVACAAEQTGPIVALSGTLTEIETPVGGWTGAWNVLDATVGRALETDAALRIRRENELQGSARSPLDAIRAYVLTVSGVSTVKVFQNNTDAVNGDGLPPHSVEVLALGGTNAAVAQAVHESVAAGIATYGSTTVAVTDASGNSQSIKFSRPTAQPIYIVANVTAYAAQFPANGSTLVRDALLARGNAFAVGEDVRAWSFAAALDGIAGVLEVSSLYIGLAPAPNTSTTLVMAARELATFDSSRITVNVVNGLP